MIRHTLLAILSLTSAVALAQNPAPHQHGVARLDVAMDGGTLRLEFSSPLDNLVGFEHAPRNAKEKATLEASIKQLNQGGSLFTLAPEAACTLVSADVHSPFPEATQGGKPAAAHQHDHDKEAHDHAGHADLDADYVFRCGTPAALRGLDVGLFDRFPRLHRLDTQVAGPRGQRSETLTPKQHKLAW